MISDFTRYFSRHNALQNYIVTQFSSPFSQLNFFTDVALTYSTENDFSKTVITVPLAFTPEQRKQVKNYAGVGGFNVSQVISEPAAALVAYGISQNDQNESNLCLVFKCGGTSLTCTVLQSCGGMFSVLGSVTKEVGGDSATDLLIELLAQEFKRKYKMDPRESKRGKMKLKINAENVKHVLSTLDNANCYIESLHEGVDFNANVSRSRFEMEFSKILSKFIDPLHEVLDIVKIKPTDIDKVRYCFFLCTKLDNASLLLSFENLALSSILTMKFSLQRILRLHNPKESSL